jgi:hypothetical protein
MTDFKVEGDDERQKGEKGYTNIIHNIFKARGRGR